jgi:hypothetical protein
MKQEKIAGLRIKYYDDFETIPNKRHQLFNKLIMLDAGIGSDLSDVVRHINVLRRLIANGEKDKANTELDNYFQSFNIVMKGISPNLLAFCALVTEVNGRPFTDLSHDSLVRLHDRLNNEKTTVLRKLINRIKRALDMEVEDYYPGVVRNGKVNEHYALLKAKALAVARGIETGNFDQANELDERIFSNYKPKNAGDLEVKQTKQIEELGLIIQKEFGRDPEKMTSFQFYSALELIKKKHKEAKKAADKQRGKRRK